MRFYMLILLVAVLQSSSPALAAKFESECPEEIKTRQTGVAVKGWATDVDMVNARQIFSGLVLFNGHPKDGVTLMPDEPAAPNPGDKSPGAGASGDIVYTLAAPETYMACQYTSTLVRLIKKIPKDAKFCRVKFSETLGHVQKAVCD